LQLTDSIGTMRPGRDSAPKRGTASDRRLLQNDKSGALQVLDKALGDNLRHDLVRVVSTDEIGGRSTERGVGISTLGAYPALSTEITPLLRSLLEKVLDAVNYRASSRTADVAGLYSGESLTPAALRD
jgi:hypothetical protein